MSAIFNQEKLIKTALKVKMCSFGQEKPRQESGEAHFTIQLLNS